MGFSVELLPASADNYIYMISDVALGLAMVIDPGDADVVLRTLRKKDLHLALILNTHHHHDHTGGNAKLQHEYGAPVIGPAKEEHRIGGLSRGVDDGAVVTFSDFRGHVIETPGHTAGHIAYYFPSLKALFSGDCLFSLGCGRLFEGTPAELWHSLTKLRSLPDDPLVYAGHEYTERNSQFALLLDKNNADLKLRANEVAALRKKGEPSLPSVLGAEKITNPFLRVDSSAFQATLAKNGFPVDGADPAAIFGALRSAKDRFEGR
ncbi:MAG: hydroxyacylglutathione hydrolase [Alphaproteobacteria bacterium]|nr:hydroxyacylglutathione hydrolase [Alphaproteobacteria bacterium]